MGLDFRTAPLLDAYGTQDIVREAELLFPYVTPRVTFWGNRVLTIQGCEGSVYLDTIAKKILQCREVSEEYQPRVEALRERIQDFYTAANRQIQEAPWFTKFMAQYPAWLSEIVFGPETPT